MSVILVGTVSVYNRWRWSSGQGDASAKQGTHLGSGSISHGSRIIGLVMLWERVVTMIFWKLVSVLCCFLAQFSKKFGVVGKRLFI